jgi:CD63 antigen
MADLSGCAKCVKYTLFVFNLLFLLAGLALIIVGAVAQVQANKISGFGPSASGAAIFLIVIGSLVFIVCFFGCAGAINNNYCMVVTFGVLLLLLLLAQVAAIIAGFVLKDKIKTAVIDEMTRTQQFYGQVDDVYTKTWDSFQRDLQCCGTTNYTSWNSSSELYKTKSVPDSCCKNETDKCGYEAMNYYDIKVFFEKGCNVAVTDIVKGSMIAVGAVAAGVALLEIIGIVFAFCLAHSLRKDYRVV